MSDAGPNVQLRPGGLPETILAPEPPEIATRLEAATETGRDAVAAIVAEVPESLQAWAALGSLGRDHIESYAAYRVGYHRGLDHLRKSGWRGSGYVRSVHPTNIGFLRCLAGLAEMAEAIGESPEAERCRTFLAQLDPDGFGTQ